MLRAIACIPFLLVAAFPLGAARKSTQEAYGQGLTVGIPVTEQELVQAVQDVVADGIIQGTKEYNKDEYVAGAESVSSTPVFPRWSSPGQVFYKVRQNALDPRNFKDSGDTGTLAVRYVVQHQDEKNTILKIDAIFLDDPHRRAHLSNGSVEAAEYKDIQDHLAVTQLRKQQAAEDEQRHQQELAAKELERKHKQQQLEVATAQAPGESLEQHVKRLRHEVERVVRTSGALLKSAPFRSASSLKPLPAGAKVVILIISPYWYGVETEAGEHGWIHRSQLERLP